MNIQNLRKAVSLLAAIPGTNWNMDVFMDDYGHGCALGHLARLGFNGLEARQDGMPMFEVKCGDTELGIKAGDKAFGFPCRELCSTLSEHELQIGLPDKEIFFNRVRKLMADNGVPFLDVFGVAEPVAAFDKASQALALGDEPWHIMEKERA